MASSSSEVELLEVADHVDEQRDMNDTFLRKYFEAAVKFEASDLLLRGAAEPQIRIRGRLKKMDVPPLDAIKFEHAIEESLSPSQWKHYGQHGAVDLAAEFPFPNGEKHRFRLNIYRTRGRSAIAGRRVNNEILPFDELRLPPILGKICERNQGLVIVAGITGSGKTTTIASMLEYINVQRACHIITVEDPIEYMFEDKKALISQREIGIDVPGFGEALRVLVRENPDVVLIGEMRDKETFEAGLQASETGHLVFGTVHASSAAQAFGRIYDLFPSEERDAIRGMLAFQIEAFVYQKLLPTVREDIHRVPAVEILLQSPATKKYILDGKEHALDEVIKDHRNGGMQTFIDSLVELVEKEYIHPRVAQANAASPEEVKMRLRGINSL